MTRTQKRFMELSELRTGEANNFEFSVHRFNKKRNMTKAEKGERRTLKRLLS